MRHVNALKGSSILIKQNAVAVCVCVEEGEVGGLAGEKRQIGTVWVVGCFVVMVAFSW